MRVVCIDDTRSLIGVCTCAYVCVLSTYFVDFSGHQYECTCAEWTRFVCIVLPLAIEHIRANLFVIYLSKYENLWDIF